MEIRLSNELEDWLLGLADTNGHDTSDRATAIAEAIADLHHTTMLDAYWPEWDLHELAAFATLIGTNPHRRGTLCERWEQDERRHQLSERFDLDHDTVGERLIRLTRTQDHTIQTRIRRWLHTPPAATIGVTPIDTWRLVGLTALPHTPGPHTPLPHTPLPSPTVAAKHSGPDHTGPDHTGPDITHRADGRAVAAWPGTAVPDPKPGGGPDHDQLQAGDGYGLRDDWYAPPPPSTAGLPGL